MTIARELLIASVVAALLAIFARTFLVQAFRIPSDSMAPGLLAGDHILVNKFIYRGRQTGGFSLYTLLPMRSVRRGDVVVFRSPREPRQNLIKRCLGLPGETLALDGDLLRVGGRSLDESGYVHRGGQPDRSRPAESFGPAVIPDHRFFFLGDHRSGSQDSRSWGPVSGQSFTGRPVVIYWSVRPGGLIAESRGLWDSHGLWDKIDSQSSVEWLERCRWRRIFKPIR